MRKTYNYQKINNNITRLNSKRNENGKFQGTSKELDKLMDLCIYNRQNIAHALCLDFKTDVTYVENCFVFDKDLSVKTDTYFLIVDDIPYTFQVEQIESEKHKSFNYKEIGVLKPLLGNKERKFIVECKDISCCGCYFIQEEIEAHKEVIWQR